MIDVSNSIITPADAFSFAMGTPDTLIIPAGSSATLTLDFNTAMAGSNQAVLVLANNDDDEAPYNINLFGICGNFASEPTQQAMAMNFTDVKSYRYTPELMMPAELSDGYIILRSTSPICLLYTSPSPRDLSTSRMPSSA